MTHASHNATNSNSTNEESTMSNHDTMINAITAAIAAANGRSDERYSAVAASRGNGSATPNWLTCDDLQVVLDEVNDGEDWEVVDDAAEIADVLGDARDVMGNDADTVAAWTVLVRVHSGEYVQPSDPREYVIMWSYGGEDAADIERAKKLNAFVRAAHDYYMDKTKKTFEELRDYQRSDWGDGLVGNEWASIDDAAEAGIDAAQQYIEGEAECVKRYRVANEFPALGDCMATYHATEADANEAAAGMIASLTDDIMAWGELTPLAPTGDATEVAAMREAYDLAASASDDAINNAGIVRMTREAAELIAARAVSITRIDAI